MRVRLPSPVLNAEKGPFGPFGKLWRCELPSALNRSTFLTQTVLLYLTALLSVFAHS